MNNLKHFVSLTGIVAFFASIPFVTFSQSSWLSVDKGKIVYGSDEKGNRIPDFSYCGFKMSEADIPLVENKISVPYQAENASEIIQQAINYIENLPLDKNGFRGAVLLDKGIYTLQKSLRISKSGVVLRGTGKNETVLKKMGVDRGALIYVEGLNDLRFTDTLSVATKRLPVNSRNIWLDGNASGLKEGDKVMICWPSTAEWIKRLGCDHFGGGITATGWKPGEMDICWDRKIQKISGNQIEIDAPLTLALNKEDPGFNLIKYSWKGRITNVGIENLALESDFNRANPKDEDHSWTGISVDNASDSWIRRVSFRHFAGSAVILQPTSSRVTVEDCLSLEPVSEIGGMRRTAFLTFGQLNLFQRCFSEKGINDFAAGYNAPGPNAFVQCESGNSLGMSGAIDSWSPGLLFDVVNIDGNNLVFKNHGQSFNGAGWGTANSLFWQCTASEIECYTPAGEGKNAAYGCWAQFYGDGEWSESNNHVQPRSFFYAQLAERLGVNVDQRARILPLNTSASSSPTVDVAMQLAEEAYIPRLTLRKFIEDSLQLSSVNNPTLLSVLQFKNVQNKSVSAQKENTIKIIGGKISHNNQLLTGGRMDVPWWSGKLRSPHFSGSKPHITRFVPGREGRGLTDRIDSVVSLMQKNNIAVLDHNYGLWYDRRRDDHERIRRRNGEVWGPFYEQAFARSGKGTAWDGLSKYDLTKPNAWYWSRLQEFAEKGMENGLLLFHENYFQHNILEAGAHWVDFPWRSANNINDTGFPEPVPFAGDKRIFMADMFYDITSPVRRELHRKYIRQCLNAFADNENVIQLTSSEFTGPLHFVQFWLDEASDWEKETGKNALIALSTTKDVQDAILADPVRSKIVDIIDIRYWHYKNDGTTYEPKGGRNLAPRQHARQMKVGSVSMDEAYRAVKEYRERYPEKAVIYTAQNYPQMAWAVLFAGGSLPGIPVVNDPDFLKDAVKMNAEKVEKSGNFYFKLGKIDTGALIYSLKNNENLTVELPDGIYMLKTIDEKNGEVVTLNKRVKIIDSYVLNTAGQKGKIFWLKRLDKAK